MSTTQESTTFNTCGQTANFSYDKNALDEISSQLITTASKFVDMSEDDRT